MDDVLSASGTGKSQFYHYFASKEALVKELVALHEERLNAPVEGVEGWLDKIVRDHEAGLYADGCPIGNLASEMAAQSEEIRVVVANVIERWEAQVGAALKDMKAKGLLRPDVVPENLASFVVGSVQGAILLAKTKKNPEPLIQTVGMLKAHIAGLGGEGSIPHTGTPTPSGKRPITPVRRPALLGFAP